MKIAKLGSYQNIILIASIFPIIVFGFLTYSNLKAQKSQETIALIKTINKHKKKLVQEHFENIKFDILNLAQNTAYLEEQAKKNIINLQELQKKHIVDYYKSIESDILAVSKKDIFQYIYSFKKRGKRVDVQYIDALHHYEREFKLKGLLMIDPQGKILYSSDEPKLINKNVKQLSKTFEKNWNTVKKLKYTTKNMLYYVQISYNKLTKHYAQYLITPFKDVNGYIAIEIPLKHIKEDISNVSSLGSSAETYLTFKQENKTLLALNRVLKDEQQGEEKNNFYINLGFTSQGVSIKKDTNGIVKLVGYIPIKIRNIQYSMQTTVTYMDVVSPIMENKNFFEQYVIDHHYKNLLLIKNEGDIFYSVKHNRLYRSDILTGSLSQSFLSNAVKKVLKTKKFFLTDIAFSPISRKDIAQYALYPILDKHDNIQIIIVLELNTNALSQKLMINDNIYTSTKTFLLAKDGSYRSNAFIYKQNDTLLKYYLEKIKVKTLPAELSFEHNASTMASLNCLGNNVLTSFDMIKFSGVNWAIITEIQENEILKNLHSLKINIYLFLAISSFIALFSMLIITNEKKKNDKKIKHQTLHDSLTQLPNRKYALEFLHYSLANAKRNKQKIAILFMDLDKFKIVNDTYGHKAGDIVLQKIANRLKLETRENDLVARLSGDEFLMIITDYKSLTNIHTVCLKLIKSISKPINNKKQEYSVGMSIGVSTFPHDSIDATELLSFADTAMYKTKDNGRNHYSFYDKAMSELSIQTIRVEKDLQTAIKQNQLVLHYQPQVDLGTKKTVGVEALVRWNHPKDGFLMPNDFIPIAENSRLIIDLGYWVLEKACTDFLNWQNKGYQLQYVAVNMSSKQLQSNDCVDKTMEILQKLSFNPKNIELEITETTLISDFDNTIKNINIFKKMGIKFSIDDFGTGYSSLSYLKNLHISTLKIDREFIKDIILDRGDRSIVTAIIAMGHALEYVIIAEGAETKEEIELLQYLQCDIVQGYYFSKPLETNKLLEFIDAQ